MPAVGVKRDSEPVETGAPPPCPSPKGVGNRAPSPLFPNPCALSTLPVMSDDYVFEGPGDTPPARDNNPPLSISDLSFALKRTLEDRFGHVRLRGEVSKVNRHASGHVYLTLKDDKAALDGVIWKGQVRSLGIQPQTGLEVIVTGKITSYPARSSYQIVIESMEAAGAGALLAQLERLKARLREEGLFEPSRKRPLPTYPAVIGVITSPTGAVIRDILHRITERWPCHVLVWPVVVQGEVAARQVADAIRGFEALTPGGPIPRPDLVIVARGGGSVEDLWPFNDEALARTVAAATLPIISAVGHETDTTLIDFVSDRRAPTPTGAAELATPVLAELAAWLSETGARLNRSGGQMIEQRRTQLRATARGLPTRPDDLLALPRQRLDLAGSRLGAALQINASKHERRLIQASSALAPRLLQGVIDRRQDRMQGTVARFAPLAGRRLDQDRARLAALARALSGLDPTRPRPGFARVEDSEGRWVARAQDLSPGQSVQLVFPDGQAPARIEGAGTDASRVAPVPPPEVAAPRKRSTSATKPSNQGDLF